MLASISNLIIFLGHLIVDYVISNNQLLVLTKNGILRGFNYDLQLTPGLSADIFLGIPYGQAKRFEKPQPPNNWLGVRDATKFGAPCQTLTVLDPNQKYSEDCHFLNIFKPSKINESKKLLPVVVYIHGGAFLFGGGFIEGYKNFTENFIPQNIIVVTIQYRLGFYGFFSNGKPELPGNYGLWDQHQALYWISNNIAAFGGNPKQITLWGQSAGSSSVSMHTLSHHSRMLFQQTFQQSGSYMSRWSLNDQTVNYSKELATKLKCTDDNDLKNCLNNLSPDDIQGAVLPNVLRYDFEFCNFNPRYDGDFFDTNFNNMIKKSFQKPSLFGFNSHESAFLTMQYGGVYGMPSAFNPKSGEYGKNELNDFINKLIVDVDKNSFDNTELNSLKNNISGYYDSQMINQKDRSYYMKQYTILLSDIQFIIPILWEAEIKSSSGWPVYVYNFNYTNPKSNQNKPFNAINHCSDYPYLEGTHLFDKFTFNENDWKIRDVMISTISNFIKTGNPSTNTNFWPQFDTSKFQCSAAKKRLPIFIINSKNQKLIDDSTSLNERFCFWNELNQFYNLKQISGLPNK